MQYENEIFMQFIKASSIHKRKKIRNEKLKISMPEKEKNCIFGFDLDSRPVSIRSMKKVSRKTSLFDVRIPSFCLSASSCSEAIVRRKKNAV